MAETVEYTEPTRFVLGTVGMPGSREFYLQVTGQSRPGDAATTTTLAVEKQQAAALADRIDQVLTTIGEVPEPAPDSDPLALGFSSVTSVGTMSIRWATDAERLVLEFFDINDDDADQELPQGQPVLRVWLTGSQARGFVTRSVRIIAAGRPPCPFCEQPLDPQGHICPRANGYRR